MIDTTNISNLLLNFSDKIEPIRRSIEKQFSSLNRPLKEIAINSLERTIAENPLTLIEGDMFHYLKLFGIKAGELEELQKEFDDGLDEMALEKTGHRLDETSKRMLRNELVLAVLLFSIGKGVKL